MYKHYGLLLLAATALTGNLSAQQQHVNIGIKGGLNMYNIHSNNNSNYDTKAGFHLGLLGHIHLSKQVALQPELTYSLQGAQYTTLGIDTRVRLGYINVPVLLQYMFDNGFRLQAGPQLGFLVNAKSKTGSSEVNIKDDIKKVDFAFGLGIGYVYPPSGIGVDARYNIGLSDISKSDASKSTNMGFQLGVFYLFKHR
jgi:Outer membrane protein beta-barrel domain